MDITLDTKVDAKMDSTPYTNIGAKLEAILGLKLDTTVDVKVDS